MILAVVVLQLIFYQLIFKVVRIGNNYSTLFSFNKYSHSNFYDDRAPEVILGFPYDGRIDVWSLGAVAAEMYTGYVLFQNDSLATMLSRIMSILGEYPSNVLEEGRDVSKYFTASNTIIYEQNTENTNNEISLIFPKKTTLASRLHINEEEYNNNNNENIIPTDETLFVDFVRESLLLDPIKRPTAKDILRHVWLESAYDIDFSSIQSIYAAPPVPDDENENDEQETEEHETEEEETDENLNDSGYVDYDDDDDEAEEAEDESEDNESREVDYIEGKEQEYEDFGNYADDNSDNDEHHHDHNEGTTK